MKKLLYVTTSIMFIIFCLAILKEKENDTYHKYDHCNAEIKEIEEQIEMIDNEIGNENSIKSKYKENNKDKVNELEIWQKQVKKIKSY